MRVIFNVAAPLLLHPKTHFEGGDEGRQMWRNHFISGSPTSVLMSHAELIDTVMMAPIAQRNRELRPMRYDTIVTAKESLRNLPYGIGWIVRNGGTTSVERVYENPNESPDQKIARKKRNLINKDIGVTILRAGGHDMKLPEGGTSRRVKLPDGSFEKIPRNEDEMLPHQQGYANIIDELPPDVRDKVRFMVIVTRYGQRRLRLLRPTAYVMKPVKPVDGTVEEIVQQGEELMARCFERAIELDKQR